MGRISKFERGQKVRSTLDKFDEFEIVEVKKNTLVVRPLNDIHLRFDCLKSMFEVIKSE